MMLTEIFLSNNPLPILKYLKGRSMSFSGWQKVIIKTSNGSVEGIAPVIISASRATDIPAFYSDWFMHRLRREYVK
jgi:hypothetical protein